MLDVNPDTVCRLIELAREFHGQERISIDEEPESTGDEWPVRLMADYLTEGLDRHGFRCD